jgi:hypothetical protein
MLSSGAGLYRGTPTTNPYLVSPFEECQREGVQVHSISWTARQPAALVGACDRKLSGHVRLVR